MIYYLAPMAFTPKSEQPAELSSLHACVVTLQSIPGCEERGGKKYSCKSISVCFPRPLDSDTPILASNFVKAMRSYLMSLS